MPSMSLSVFRDVQSTLCPPIPSAIGDKNLVREYLEISPRRRSRVQPHFFLEQAAPEAAAFQSGVMARAGRENRAPPTQPLAKTPQDRICANLLGVAPRPVLRLLSLSRHSPPDVFVDSVAPRFRRPDADDVPHRQCCPGSTAPSLRGVMVAIQFLHFP